MAHLYDRSILNLGTIRLSKVPNNQLPNEKINKKKEHGLLQQE